MLLSLLALPAYSADWGRPKGANCDLISPPLSAGEEMNHGIVLRIFPRAKDIKSTYTGCQALFVQDGDKWAVASLVEIVAGDPIRVWSPDDDADLLTRGCRFEHGKVIEGDPNNCPMVEFLLIKSLAPGCVRVIQDAVAKHGRGARIPPECEYQ